MATRIQLRFLKNMNNLRHRTLGYNVIWRIQWEDISASPVN